MKTLYRTLALVGLLSVGFLYSFKPFHSSTESMIQRIAAPEGTKRTVIKDMIASKRSSALFKEYSVLEYNDTKKADDFAKNLSTFTLNKSALSNLNIDRPDNMSFKFQTDKETILDLTRSAVFSQDFKCKVKDYSGEHEVTGLDLGLHYRGVIRGNENSIVTISIYQDFIMGIVSDDSGNYNLGPKRTSKRSALSNEYVYYNDRDMIHRTGFDCETGELASEITHGINAPDTGGGPPPCVAVNIYLEADYSMYVQSGGNVPSLLAFMGGVFNNVAAIYQNESIPIIWGNYFVWGVPDPYTASNDPQTILGLFTANHNGSFPAGTMLAQLQSFRMGSPGAGYSNLAVVCNPTLKTSFASIENTYNIYPTYSNAVDLSAHEFGHSFGSRHTHACVWNGNNTGIDQCVVTAENAGCAFGPASPIVTGTIMSYCVPIYGGATNFTLGFGPQPGAVIRFNYSGSCACLLPVELSSFNSQVTDNNVTLRWFTGFETNNAFFDIERYMVTENTWKNIGRVTGSGTTTSPKEYTYSDRGLQPGVYRYRLKQIDFNGNFEYHDLSVSVIISNPVTFALEQNYPNPFNPSTKINYRIPESSVVSLKIYDIRGRMVSTLFDNVRMAAGNYSVSFEGKDLSAGTYIYRLEVNGTVVGIKKMMLIK